jgi:hypothetical protein
VGTQAPPVQVVVPCELVHCLPQTPQLLVVVVLVSQPSSGLPLQLPQPAVHEGTQHPVEQLVDPCAFAHCLPQLPQ